MALTEEQWQAQAKEHGEKVAEEIFSELVNKLRSDFGDDAFHALRYALPKMQELGSEYVERWAAWAAADAED